MKYAPAIHAILNDGPTVKLQRAGWIQSGWWIEARQRSDLTVPILVRVQGANVWPWGPTEDDVFAADWSVNGDAAPCNTELPAGGYPWACAALEDGATVIPGGLPVKLRKVAGLLGGVQIQAIAILLPQGARRIWRPQIQDMLRTDYKLDTSGQETARAVGSAFGRALAGGVQRAIKG